MSNPLRFLLLGVLLLIGVFVGIDIAESNIQKMQGIEGAAKAIQVSTKPDHLEVNVLGQVVKAHAIDAAKVEKVQQTLNDSENIISNIGNSIGSNLRYYSRMMLGTIFSWVKL
jgi:hypothetical protein